MGHLFHVEGLSNLHADTVALRRDFLAVASSRVDGQSSKSFMDRPESSD
jgi:hypothetical protein